MNKLDIRPCAKAVALFRGLYARVADDLGVDPSYVSRIARGQRKSKPTEVALDREFNKAVAFVSKLSKKNRAAARARTSKVLPRTRRIVKRDSRA